MEKTAILMTSWHKTTQDTRCVLTHQIIEEAASKNYPVVIVDGSDDPAIAESFRERGAIVFPQQERGMGPSRREVFAHAGQPSIHLPPMASMRDRITPMDWQAPIYFVWMEEKPDLVRSIPLLVAPLVAGEAEIVIAKRLSMETWPAFQQESETRANAAYREATGMDYDPMFGPVAFSFRMLRFFRECRPERYGVSPYAAGYIQHFAPLESIAAGYMTTSITVNCSYPEQQRQEEETVLNDAMREKRLAQETELSAGYPIAMRALGDPRPRLWGR